MPPREGADALVIVTEWDEFRALDLDRSRVRCAARSWSTCATSMTARKPRKPGLTYYGVGRGRPEAPLIDPIGSTISETVDLISLSMEPGRVSLSSALAMSGFRWRSRWRGSSTTIGFDIDADRIAELREGHDRTREVDERRARGNDARLTAAAEDCAGADVYIVTVPTPVDAANRPDLGAVIAATRMIARLIDPARRPTDRL